MIKDLKNNSVFRKILSLWKKGLLPVTFLIIATSISFTYPMFSKKAIDTVIIGKRYDLLYPLALAFLALNIMQRLFLYLNTTSFYKFSKNNILEIQKDLLTRIFYYPMEFFDKNHSGYLLGRVRGDVTGLSFIFSDGIVQILMDIIKFIGAFLILSFMNLKLTLICLAILPLIIFKILTSKSKIKKINKKIIEGHSELEKELSDTFQGMEVIKSFSKEKEGIKRVYEKLNWYNDIEIKRNIINAKYNNFLNFLVDMGSVLLLFFGVKEIMTMNLTIGGYMAFSGYLYYLYAPAHNLSNSVIFLDYAKRSYDRISELMKLIPENHDGLNLDSINKIDIKDLTFFYDENNSLINKFSLTINRGEKILLKGSSGQGKTTIIKILLGLYKPKSGQIFYNDNDMETINLKHLREKNIAYISQNIFLFNKSIKENIIFEDSTIKDEDLLKILKMCKLENKINSLKNGLYEIVSEKGVNFSGGEKQRLALARALVKKSDVLIIDEGTSNLDENLEEELMDIIKSLFKDKIIIKVTHRKVEDKSWRVVEFN